MTKGEKISAAKMGHEVSGTTRAKISASKMGKKMPPRSVEHRAALSASLKGHKFSPETRAKISATKLSQHRTLTPEHRGKIALGVATSLKRRYSGTQPEQLMAALLENCEIEFDGQKLLAGKSVDFYLPESNSVIEVDGAYWHPNGPDRSRDQHLLDHGVSFVHHITDTQLRTGGWL